MSSFHPLNVIFEDESEEEIDDSKEIQIEEALKLYQTALKLHSQGPDSFDGAESAYKELLKSEIFQWPESLSETKWLELYDDADPIDEFDEAVDLDKNGVISSDGAPSTLPQILYLTYKNHGQFRLDRLRHDLAQLEAEIASSDRLQGREAATSTAYVGLDHFSEALIRDDSDDGLWRRAARVAEYLDSSRINRFCLEAVIDHDTANDFNDIGKSLAIELRLAWAQLKPLYLSITDTTGEDWYQQHTLDQRPLGKALRTLVDPFMFLRSRDELHKKQPAPRHDPEIKLEISDNSWAAVGKAILCQIREHMNGTSGIPTSGATYTVNLPAEPSKSEGKLADSTMDVDAFSQSVKADQNVCPKMPISDRLPDTSDMHLHDALLIDKNKDADRKVHAESNISVEYASPPVALNDTIDNSGERFQATRKRSCDAAELPEQTDTLRSRSKRIKARTSLNESSASKEDSAEDWAKWYEQQLQVYIFADDAAFLQLNDVLQEMDHEPLKSTADLRRAMYKEEVNSDGSAFVESENYLQLFQKLLQSWDIMRSRAFLHGDVTFDMDNASSIFTSQDHSSTNASASSHPDVMPEGHLLTEWSTKFANAAPGILELGLYWLAGLLQPQTLIDSPTETTSLYAQFRWSDDLKATVVQMLVCNDEYVYSSLSDCFMMLDTHNFGHSEHFSADLVQSIFELHLDIYSRITNPDSAVDETTRIKQQDSMSRWARLAADSIALQRESIMQSEHRSPSRIDKLSARYLWSTIVCNSLLDPDLVEHSICCYQDISSILRDQPSAGQAMHILLPNNAVMPEISVEAAEKETSRLMSIDFFSTIFTIGMDDAVDLIDRLEPFLEATLSEAYGGFVPHTESEALMISDPVMLQALRFMKSASLPAKLLLWQKLRDAYTLINYAPQILMCDMRSMSLIIEHFRVSLSSISATHGGANEFLHCMHRLDGLLVQIVRLLTTELNAFECMDERYLTMTLKAVADLLRVVHVFALWEDSIRVGQSQAPQTSTASAAKLQTKAAERFRDMIVRIWTLQYYLLREAFVQQQLPSETYAPYLIKLLHAIHKPLGLRTYCGLASRVFIKLTISESIRMRPALDWDLDIPQLLLDLYGIKVFSSSATQMEDHGCEPIEIDKKTAHEILDLVLLHVNRMSVKDLLKSDIKYAVDKIQQVIKLPKLTSSTIARQFNKRLIASYLKNPLNPVELFRSLRGIGGLCGAGVKTEGWEVASKGWYFLLGHIALTKFRSQKRLAQGSIDDLEHAKVFFKHDLEFDTERWETWYRLAQAYDTTIDEYTTWTSDKLEHDMSSLMDLQRYAILCYSAALACANRSADASFENADKLANLYADFGTRLYASTREPFSMKALQWNSAQKHYNGSDRGMYTAAPFPPLGLYAAWKLASSLLRQASLQRSDDWHVHYALGKVLWKMHNCNDDILGRVKRIPYMTVIDAIYRALECVPEKRDTRHPEKDPILEPHYKLICILHKLVQSGRCDPEQARKLSTKSAYAWRVSDSREYSGWSVYVQDVLKSLRSADKSNWHHRMVARAAHIIYDADPGDFRGWLGARLELTQQIFTKTMTVQVWKPDNERAGRHFVYTARYVRFFGQLLSKLDDKDNLEALVRRIRKRGSDFVGHASIWHDLGLAYLAILRRRVRNKDGHMIPQGYEEQLTKGTEPEEFSINATRLENWIQDHNSTCAHLDDLRDAIEFKKLNNGLLKTSLVEELIGDIYVLIYQENIEHLKEKEVAEEGRTRMRVDNILAGNAVDEVPSITTDPTVSDVLAISKRKATTVTHREIIKRAEALMIKAPPIATPKPMVRIPTIHDKTDQATPVKAPLNATDLDVEPASVPDSPVSIQRSANDESELSDLDDDLVETDGDRDDDVGDPQQGQLFPNLVNSDTSGLGLRIDNQEILAEVEDVHDLTDAEMASSAISQRTPDPESRDEDAVELLEDHTTTFDGHDDQIDVGPPSSVRHLES